ncbi:hypothetical protein BST95_01780 [Halioglobus japonicus]|uniref:Uncharacterized protein n=1 Tax=Halioglobus japonicus TaxID=930805 RepID=A0AAP8MCD9_9GAMM|nr:hypothetical protein BST95_01780 [Halioglobus japonicus]PLW85044.1 hypothetical protein C0029_16045 [Halioglobus japonicus]GHD19181.1 hypothetical protein GCM10007052_27330 [Halioglobus japonicus]
MQCESSLKPRVEPGEDPESAAPKGWINARTPNDAKIFVLGKLDDGFVQATAAAGGIVSAGPGAHPEPGY